jgi:hypothetical protein
MSRIHELLFTGIENKPLSPNRGYRRMYVNIQKRLARQAEIQRSSVGKNGTDLRPDLTALPFLARRASLQDSRRTCGVRVYGRVDWAFTPFKILRFLFQRNAGLPPG